MDLLMPLGCLSWNELVTTNATAAKAFYGRLLGWDFEECLLGDGRSCTLAKTGNGPAGTIFEAPGGMALDAHWSPFAVVADVNRAANQVEAMGGVLIHPVTNAPGIGRFCMARDPQGAMFTLIAYG